MSNIKLSGNPGGTGTLTIASPNTNSDLTLNLPTTMGNNGTSALVSTDASGNLGIGVTPTAKLSVAGSTAYAVTSSGNATTSGIDINSSAGGAGLFGGAISFGAGGTGRAAIAALQNTTDNDTATLAFFIHASGTSSTDASEAMRITSDGYLRMASGTGGIQFNGDTAAANALNDYEEGTFTPTLSSDGTAPTVSSYTTRLGTYTKVGNVVTALVSIRATISAAGTGTPRITGLPFANANNLNGIARGLTNLFSTQPTHIYTTDTYVVCISGVYLTGSNNYITFTVTYTV